MLVERGGSPRPINKYLTDSDDGLNWIKISDATASDKYIYKTKQKILKEGLHKTRLVNEGDFLLSNSMSFGRPYIMKTSGCIHDGWLVLKEKEAGLLDKDFLYHLLGSPYIFEQFDKLAAGSTVRNLNIGLVSSVSIPIPPLEEQKQIVAVLDKAFAAIDLAKANIEKNLQNAKELFQSKLNEIFTQKGEGWEEKALGESVKSISTGPFGSLLHKSDYSPNGIPLVNPIHMVNKRIVPDDKKQVSKDIVVRLKNYILKENDIVVARRGDIGRCALVEEEQNGWLCGTGSFFISPSDELRSDFLVELISLEFYAKKLLEVATGATMKNISNKSLKALHIAFPSAEIQKEIMGRVRALDNKTKQLETAYQQKLNSLDELKKSILQKAFAGELVIK